MQGQAANLTERDILDLAAYFSEQKGLYVKN
jgi:cytochrome c553